MTKTSERFRRRGVLVLVGAGAMTVASACGGGGGGDDGASATPAGAGGGGTTSTSGGSDPGATIKACDVVTLVELGDVFDKEVILDQGGSNDFTCSYQTKGGAPFVFNLNVGPASGSAEEIVDQAMATFDGTEAIDIGEGGYLAFGGSQLDFIQDGIDYQVNLGGGGMNPPPDPRDYTIAVAELVESKL